MHQIQSCELLYSVGQYLYICRNGQNDSNRRCVSISFKNITSDQMIETLQHLTILSSGRFSALLGVTHTILIRHQTLTLNITNILLGRFSSFGGSGLHSINRQRHRHQMYLTMSVETSYQGGQCPCLATWSCLELSSSPVGADTHSTLLLLLPPPAPLLSSVGPDNQNDIR